MWFPNSLLEKQYQDAIVGWYPTVYFHLGQYKVCGITFVYEGCGSKFVYLQILTILWKYTDLLLHPLYKLPCKPNYKQLRINALLKVTQDNRKFLEVLDKIFRDEKEASSSFFTRFLLKTCWNFFLRLHLIIRNLFRNFDKPPRF